MPTPQLNVLLNKMLDWASNQPNFLKLFPEDPTKKATFINEIAYDLANKISLGIGSPELLKLGVGSNTMEDPNLSPFIELLLKQRSTPHNILDTNKTTNILDKLLVQLLIKAIIKKYDPENNGITNLSPEAKLQLQEELRNTLTQLFSDIKDTNTKDLLVDQILEKILGKDFAPRPQPSQGQDRVETKQKDLTPRLYPVIVVDGEGDMVAFEGVFTTDPSGKIDRLADIESRGNVDELRFVISKVYEEELIALATRAIYETTLHK